MALKNNIKKQFGTTLKKIGKETKFSYTLLGNNLLFFMLDNVILYQGKCSRVDNDLKIIIVKLLTM